MIFSKISKDSSIFKIISMELSKFLIQGIFLSLKGCQGWMLILSNQIYLNSMITV